MGLHRGFIGGIRAGCVSVWISFNFLMETCGTAKSSPTRNATAAR